MEELARAKRDRAVSMICNSETSFNKLFKVMLLLDTVWDSEIIYRHIWQLIEVSVPYVFCMQYIILAHSKN